MNSIRSNISKIIALIFLLTISVFSQETREVKQTVDLASDGQVSIDTYKGSIKIETWEKPLVEIYAQIEADGYGKHEREKVRDTEIKIHSSANRVDIRTDYDRVEDHHFSFFGLFDGNSGVMPFVHYRITMPASAKLKIKDYKSDTKIVNLNAPLKMETYKGTVEFSGANNSIDIETYKGELTISFSKFVEDCSFETYKGRIDLAIPKESSFKIDADIGRRADLNCDFNFDVNKKFRHSESFIANVNNGGPSLRINSEKGDIRIREK